MKNAFKDTKTLEFKLETKKRHSKTEEDTEIDRIQ